MNQDFVKFLRLQCPPIPDQTAIASYLDLKTSAIDRKVALLEQKIIHYQQLRKSLINETVCRGLDKNAKLKDSGIEWIGMIPEHWEVRRFKSFAQTIKGKNLDFSDVYFEKSLPNLSLEYLRNDEVVFQTYCYSSSKSLLVNEDDYIIVWDGAGVGEILNGKKGYLSSTIAKIVVNAKLMAPKYFFHLRDKIEYTLKQIPAGMGIPHLNPFVLNNFPCPFPPLTEQTAIAVYLDEKTQKIDSIVSNIKSQIETLKELRKTLINDVVTGKIKVTD
jgi:type I restriction enzyme S subunit